MTRLPVVEPDADAWARIRAWIVRSSDDRVIAGVAGGLAARLRIGSAYVRAAFVVLILTGGVGLVLYALTWPLGGEPVATAHEPRDLEPRKRAGLALCMLATILALRGFDLWIDDAAVWSGALVAFGVAAIWDRSERSESGTAQAFATTAPGRARIVVGAALMLAGLLTFSGSLQSMRQLGPVVVAVGITTAGFMLIFGPWVVRLAGDLATERRDRIRSEERSEMAAHLHDSVLQTLALIQRSDDPKKMVTLARSQERELRNWLYGHDRPVGEVSLSASLEAAAGRVERAHDVPVEVVVVNDIPVTSPAFEAVVKAASEAMNNAARHSGAPRVSVYAEAMNGTVDVYVSDQGGGFEIADVPEDRHGVRESILARMNRHGGNATILSEPGEGTEVHLEMPMEVA
jgi:signal transduction histidine kinase/phage shock protein PspC (stress-responsive transcriptional regulator)